MRGRILTVYGRGIKLLYAVNAKAVSPTSTVPMSRSRHVLTALALWLSMTKEAVTAIHTGGSNRSARKGDRLKIAHKVNAKAT